MIQKWIEYIQKKRSKSKKSGPMGPAIVDLRRRELFSADDAKKLQEHEDGNRMLIYRNPGSGAVDAD